MKTSNIILISFLIFLFGGITLLYIGSSYYNDNNDVNNFTTEEKKIASFSVVVAEPGAIFILKNGKENKMIQPYSKDSVANFPPHLIRNDTLFISSVKPIKGLKRDYRIIPDVFCINVKSIVAKEYADISMKDFKADTLHINMNKSNLDLRFSTISYISLQAKNSQIYLEGEKLGNLNIQLDKTRINSSIKKRTDDLSGSLINSSDLRFSMTNSVRLDADNTSNYDFFNYSN